MCENGGYEDPRNCMHCKCPPGLGGMRCERIAESTPGCGGIQAPSGRIHVEVIESNFVCDSSCADEYLEIKHTKNSAVTQHREEFCQKGIRRLYQFTISNSSDSKSIPTPPPAPWEGNGGLTGLLAANEAGIDNTFETLILKDFPRAIG
ncbi:unnamed protein product [Strongylus vulgaris]|uniref:EGF-like domain-containing protein n=1 Tax=Strongylus vulgaris TaxID=40348 RepID=A0A3P7JBB4_STRVU|nr:unnamed protein product [Strongylus vulgaris]